MGLFDNSGYFSRGEKRTMQTAALFPAGIFIILIGVSVGVWYVWAFGAVCLITAIVTGYKSSKSRRDAKRVAREEAELRAYQLRQFRNQEAENRGLEP